MKDAGVDGVGYSGYLVTYACLRLPTTVRLLLVVEVKGGVIEVLGYMDGGRSSHAWS